MHGATLDEQNFLEQINKIVLLRIKTLIIKSLKKEDIFEFEQIIKSNNSNRLLSFADKKIPNFSQKVYQEIEQLKQKLQFS